MKTIEKTAALFALAIFLSQSAFAQTNEGWSFPKKKFEVITHERETCNLNKRKLYRDFLTQSMKECPYISNFHIIQLKDSNDTCYVVWIYDVNEWSDITHFYEWVFSTIHSSKDSTLLQALAPYKPNYSIGGAIEMHQLSKAMAKH